MKIPADHPALPGHFPGHPVVPGVVLLASVIQALSRQHGRAVRVTGFPAIKFLAPLLPEQAFDVRLNAKAPGRTAFEIVSGAATLANGTISHETD